MKAILMTATGGTEVLKQEDVPIPELITKTDILVKLKAAGVNPIDTKLRQGVYPMETLPAILGCDGAGVVEAVADEVSLVSPGDEVYFFYGGLNGMPGNYAEYIVLDQKFAVPKPSSLDFVQAAAAPLVLLTAWESLHDRANIQAGQTVLIHAGAGGVGHVAIQLAKLIGAKVAATVGSDEKSAFVKSLGADIVINYKTQDFVEAVMDWTGGRGVDMVMDNVGSPVFEKSFAAVRFYGDLVTLLQIDPVVDWSTARFRNLRISQEIMLTPLLFALEDALKHQRWILEECARLIDAQKLQVHVSQAYPLEQAALAHQQIETGTTQGKIVLTID